MGDWSILQFQPRMDPSGTFDESPLGTGWWWLHEDVHSPVDTLNSNWAYMVMTSLAWSLKAWYALLIPVSGRWREKHEAERENVLKMEFRTFLNAFVRLPAQIVKTGRRVVYRLLGWNRWQDVFLRGTDQLRGCLRC